MKGAKSLLTIPKQDDETYLLVELPESFPIGSLLQAGSFVGHKSSSQACLVTGDSSFSLCRVETSNALVLVPPANNSETSESQPPPNKKQMTSVSNEGGLAITPCHLLGAGSGAFFLQLKERHLHLKDLHDLLSTFDPYDPEAKFEGKSLDQLALELQVSKVQVQKGLTDLRAFEHESKYNLLSEEAWQEARRAIISALTECDDFAEFASCGLERKKLIQEGLKRLTESFLQGHGVLQLAVSSITSKEDTETIWIDFDKVVIFVAHELFARVIWSHEDLLNEMQARLPGICDRSQLNFERLLQGVAIRKLKNEWLYLPLENLELLPVKRLSQLFDAQEKWTREELDPYLKQLLRQSTDIDEFLLKHALPIVEYLNGTSVTMYARKYE